MEQLVDPAFAEEAVTTFESIIVLYPELLEGPKNQHLQVRGGACG